MPSRRLTERAGGSGAGLRAGGGTAYSSQNVALLFRERSLVPTAPQFPPPTSFRLSSEARRLLRAIAEHHGLRATSTLEFIIREAARSRGLVAEPPLLASPEPSTAMVSSAAGAAG